MSKLNSLSSGSRSTNSSLVCFDGTNLELLTVLREYFNSYSLSVIDNDEATKTCVYQVICGQAALLETFNANLIKNCNRRLVIAINANPQQAAKLATRFDAKVATIANSILTKDDARVVFGFLFSEQERIKTIHDIQKMPEQKTESIQEKTANETTIKAKEKKHSKNTISWQQQARVIDDLLKDIYRTKKKTKPRLIFLKHIGILLILLLSIHVSSMMFSFFLLNRLIEKPTKLLAYSSVVAVNIATYSGKVLVAPFLSFSITENYGRLLKIQSQISDVIQLSLTQTTNMNFIKASAGIEHSTLVSISQLNNNWKLISDDISLILSDLKTFKNISNMPWSIQWVQQKIEAATVKLSTIQKSGNLLSSLANLYPSLTGGSSNKKYLLLLQNNRELRPTGGFIGTVGIIHFSNNQLQSVTIDDVYTIDGQLKGHVDPPLPIRTILNQEHWYLRDSNWSADFSKSANQAQWFYEKSTGQTVDGVIAISLPVVEELLSIIGPVYLQDYNITVDQQSLFEHLHTSIHDDFFAGSQQKKNIITNLSYALKNKIGGLDASEYIQIGSLLSKSLQNRNIQLYSSDPVFQQEILAHGWAGQFPPVSSCHVNKSQQCINDLFAVVEANLAVNKVNSEIERSFNRSLSLNNNELVKSDSLVWINNSNEDTVAGGDYTSYVRLYYPTGTTIQSVQINNQLFPLSQATTSAVPIPYAELIDEKPGLLTLGIAINVKPTNSTTVQVNSTQPLSNTFSSYSLSIYKQAGVQEIPFSLSATLPETTDPDSLLPVGLVAKNGQITYNTKLQRDELVFVSFIPEDP